MQPGRYHGSGQRISAAAPPGSTRPSPSRRRASPASSPASFARIFYRNAINIGLPILECPEAAEEIRSGDQVEVDFDTGSIRDITTGKTFQAQPFPPFIQEIITAGGLVNAIKEGRV